MKTLTVTALFLALAVPALGQQQTVILDQQGRPAVVGNKDNSGNIIYYDLNRGQPTYWGQQQGNQTNLYPFPAPAQPLMNPQQDPYRDLGVPRTPVDGLNEK
jgi:hypothetical protein